MKKLFLLGILATCIPAALAQTPQQIFNEGQRAFVAGDIDTARAKFEGVLEADPKHQPSLNYLRMIAAREKDDTGAGAQAKRLERIILPQVNFAEADLDSVLKFLKQKGEEAGGESVKINFVPQVPRAHLEGKTVTLNLTSIPFLEVLRYVGNLTDTEFKLERHAIVVVPARSGQVPADAPGSEE